ncbi:hypothetical protein DPMN_057922 [Dreissena polymorpha]|uniref:Uncharacterized protein n=1 Tax=Dreissena polymorpha TaxID=45954 RepID=A0A9D4C125_DREPO|nr:hypothetical protein DPMN_057922 [Dreissena polymorpha]
MVFLSIPVTTIVIFVQVYSWLPAVYDRHRTIGVYSSFPEYLEDLAVLMDPS